MAVLLTLTYIESLRDIIYVRILNCCIIVHPLQQLSMEGSDGNISAADYSSGTDNSIVSSPEPPVETVQLESRLAVERDLLENDTSLLSAEREKLLEDLAAKEEKLKREKAEQEAMLSKIKALESKLISGTGELQLRFLFFLIAVSNP